MRFKTRATEHRQGIFGVFIWNELLSLRNEQDNCGKLIEEDLL